MLMQVIQDVAFPSDRPKLARYFAADPFPTDGPLGPPWTAYTAGGAAVPSVTGGVLRLKSDTAAAVAHEWRTVTVSGNWETSVTLSTSTSTLISGADDGRVGLTLQPESGGPGIHGGPYRTGLGNGTYLVFSTWSAAGTVAQTGPNGPSRAADLSKAPQIGHRFGIRFAGESLYLTANGINVSAALNAPAWVKAGGRIRFGIAATYGANVSVDDWQVTSE